MLAPSVLFLLLSLTAAAPWSGYYPSNQNAAMMMQARKPNCDWYLNNGYGCRRDVCCQPLPPTKAHPCCNVYIIPYEHGLGTQHQSSRLSSVQSYAQPQIQFYPRPYVPFQPLPMLQSMTPVQGGQGAKMIQALVSELQVLAQHDDKSSTDPPTDDTILSLPPIYEVPENDRVSINSYPNEETDANTADDIAEASLHHVNVDINVSSDSKGENNSTSSNNKGGGLHVTVPLPNEEEQKHMMSYLNRALNGILGKQEKPQ